MQILGETFHAYHTPEGKKQKVEREKEKAKKAEELKKQEKQRKKDKKKKDKMREENYQKMQEASQNTFKKLQKDGDNMEEDVFEQENENKPSKDDEIDKLAEAEEEADTESTREEL